MKAASALLAFVAVGVVMVAMGDTETMMEGTTELLQEAAHEGAKAKEGLQEAAKGGEKMTMKIWGKEVSMAKVHQARKQLHHVVAKMSVKRPEILNSMST